MTRYYFDIRDNGHLYADEEGLEFADLRDAKVEAAHTLAGVARDSAHHGRQHDVTIEVRTTHEQLFCVSLVFHGPKH